MSDQEAPVCRHGVNTAAFNCETCRMEQEKADAAAAEQHAIQEAEAAVVSEAVESVGGDEPLGKAIAELEKLPLATHAAAARDRVIAAARKDMTDKVRERSEQVRKNVLTDMKLQIQDWGNRNGIAVASLLKELEGLSA